MNERDIYHAALELTDPAKRSAYLDQACAGDLALRQHIEGLLGIQAQLGSFLETPPVSPAVPLPLGMEPGAVIGPYKLLQKLGEGGMGTVWVAEQQEPVKRRVALKLIKPGLDSAQVLRRFDTERQALALMEHENIARVLDAGATSAGRPYFVMELVHGVPITRYCDELHLTIRERLQLLVPVCRAIQHAHQKGIIHRDIKPSNVLVCMQDGKLVPKVIDFGVAKALHQRLGEGSLSTEFGAVIGTLEYMSPEQAEMSPLGVDTRSDVYALGVLAYEMLTGTTPLDKTQLRNAAYSEMLRLIKEADPPRPSTRLTDSKESLPNLAALRRTEPARLTKEVRGELDWIVMKALEKDRTRRYEGASSLAADIERYLHDGSVEACPQSVGYRLRKFVRRHRGAVLAAVGLLILLIGGIIGTTWGLVRAEWARGEAVRSQQKEAEQRKLAEANEEKAVNEKRVADAVRQFLQHDLLRQAGAAEQANTLRQLGGGFEVKENPTIKELLDRAAAGLTPMQIEKKFPGQPAVQASILKTVGDTYADIGEYNRAAEFLLRSSAIYRDAFGAESSEHLAAANNLAYAFMAGGKLRQAMELFEWERDVEVRKLGPDEPTTLTTMNLLALTYQRLGRLSQAIELFEQVRTQRSKTLGADHQATLTTMNNLALAYISAGKVPQGTALLEQLRDSARTRFGEGHPNTLTAILNLAAAQNEDGKPAQAIEQLEPARGEFILKLGADHPTTLSVLNNLALAYQMTGQLQKAIQLYEQVRHSEVNKLGPDHPNTLTTVNNLGGAYQAAGDLEHALPLFRQAVEGIEKRQYQHEDADSILGNLAVCLDQMHQYAAAEPSWRQVLVLARARGGVEAPVYREALALLGANLLKQKKWLEAEPTLRECLALREKLAAAPKPQVAAWQVGNMQSMLGEALTGQKNYAAAEPLLLAGYQALKTSENTLPKPARVRLTEATERLVQYYEATNRNEEAAKWRAELEALKAKSPAPQPKTQP